MVLTLVVLTLNVVLFLVGLLAEPQYFAHNYWVLTPSATGIPSSVQYLRTHPPIRSIR